MTRTTTLFITSLLILAACKKQAPPVALEVDEPPPQMMVDANALTNTTASAMAAMRDHFSRVHFETDDSSLDEQGKKALAANVVIMQKHPAIMVEVQGHADERGTTDYNLALGNRRAESVKTYMVAQGLSPDRISVLTYGEESPLVAGSDEPAWSQNRRAEFRISKTAMGDSGVKGTTEK